jgi:PPP family 3-phenylpropionic acid transporter
MLADRLGQRRKVMAAGAGLAVCTSLSLLGAHDFVLIAAILVCQGAAVASLGPLSDSLALGLAREGRMTYGPPRAAGSAAFMLAAALGGQVLALTGTGVVPLLIAGGFLACCLIALNLPEPAHPAPAPSRRGRFTGGFSVLRLADFRLTLLSSALVQGSHAAFYSFAPLHWRSLGITDGTIGLLIAVGIVAEVALFMWGRRLVEYLGPAGLTFCAAAAGVLRWSVTAMTGDLLILFPVQALHAVTFAFQHQSAMLMLQRVIPHERASTAQALYGALGMGAPTGLMTFASGFLYARIGGHLYFVMALMCALALPLVPRLTLREGARNTGE